MYKLALASILFLCSFAWINNTTDSINSTTQIEDFLKDFVKDRDCKKISLSGNLFSFKNGEGGDSHVDLFQLYIFDEEDPLRKNDISSINNMVKKSKLELLNMVRSGDSRIEIYVKDDGEVIKDVFMLIQDRDDESGIILHAEGEIQYSDLENLNIDFEGSEELKNYKHK